MGDEKLVFNGVDGSTGKRILSDLEPELLAPLSEVERVDKPELAELEVKAGHPSAYIATVDDPTDLAETGWAIVFAQPSDEGTRRHQEAIREALAPLLTHRRAQAGSLYREYRDGDGYRWRESKREYMDRLGAGPGPARPTDVPYYMLLVASPEEIPYEVQYQIDINRAVGRIHFDTVEDYARYAQSVVRSEESPPRTSPRAAFFDVVSDCATKYSSWQLVSPLCDYVERKWLARGWQLERYSAHRATKPRLGNLLSTSGKPALLFTASHGVSMPCGHPHQRDVQGSLLLGSPASPEDPDMPVAPDSYFSAADLEPDSDLSGMIAFHFGCYSAGTPHINDFRDYDNIRQLEPASRFKAPQPFVARLPQGMLALPGGGALAVVGHVDRAWGVSFRWPSARRKTQIGTFECALRDLLASKPVGLAMEAFNGRYAELESDQSARRRCKETLGRREAAMMNLHSLDARNYVVVGDPAVRLRVEPTATAG